ANHGSGDLAARGDVRARRRDAENPSEVFGSQLYGLGECRWGDIGLQHAGRNDVNRVSQQAFQFDLQRSEIEQIGTRREVNQKVDIPGRVFLAAHDAAEDADVGDVVGARKRDDLVAMPGEAPAKRG